MIYDISPPVDRNLRVWPGDTEPRREVLLDMKRGDHLTLSTLHSTVHLGSHADAPSHYGKDAATIEEQPLDLYVGPCQVMHASATPGQRLRREDLAGALFVERLLIRTGTFPDPTRFNEDFAALSPELVSELHEEGVVLVGIDTPSVDLFDSKELPAHRAFLRHNMAILEGLVLTEVPEGSYELIALPLKLVGFDASPVRAILRTVS